MSKESTKSAKVAYLKSREGRSNVINCFWAIIIAIIFLFPIYWLIQMSFKTDMESFGKIVTYYPHEFTVDPWLQNLQDKDFITSLKNSVLIALCSMCLSLVFGIPAAYGMGRYKVKGTKSFMLTFLVTQMLPASVMLTPMYLIFSKAGLLGTYLAPALAISSGSVPFIVVTLRPYFKSIPVSLDEAARIDGSGEFRTFNSIVLPLMKPAIAVQAIFTFVSSWNNYFTPALILHNDKMKTLPILIAQLRAADWLKFDMGQVYVMIAFSIFPVIVVYLILSKHIVQGVALGSVKG